MYTIVNSDYPTIEAFRRKALDIIVKRCEGYLPGGIIPYRKALESGDESFLKQAVMMIKTSALFVEKQIEKKAYVRKDLTLRYYVGQALVAYLDMQYEAKHETIKLAINNLAAFNNVLREDDDRVLVERELDDQDIISVLDAFNIST